MRKNNLNDVCFINPGLGDSKIEAVFYYGLTNINKTWYCDVIVINEEINHPRIITIKYDNVSFPGDDDRKTWSYFLRLAAEKKERDVAMFQRERARIGKKLKFKLDDPRKIVAETPIYLN